MIYTAYVFDMYRVDTWYDLCRGAKSMPGGVPDQGEARFGHNIHSKKVAFYTGSCYTTNMKLSILVVLAFLTSSCNREVDNRPLGKYELPTEKLAVKEKCESLFKQFHGKFEKHKHYGKTEKVSTLHIYMQPDCAVACFTSQFYWVCDFETDDEESGRMHFNSRVFTE